MNIIDIESCFDPIFEYSEDDWEDNWCECFARNVVRSIGGTRYRIESSFGGTEPLLSKVKRLIFEGGKGG